MSRSRLRIMRRTATRAVRPGPAAPSKGFSHIPAACQPAKIFKMAFGLERGPYRLSIAREAKELPPFRAR